MTAVGVSTMGGCDNVRSAAQALINEYLSYYFLIDRDDQDQQTVDKSWQSFPKSNEYNMLIWHKRELKDYFVDPDYIEKSSFLKPNINIRNHICDECNRRIFLDAANLTLYSISRELRKPLPIPHFRNRDEFQNQNAGKLKLEELATTMDDKKILVANLLKKDAVNQRYIEFIEELSAGTNLCNMVRELGLNGCLVRRYFERSLISVLKLKIYKVILSQEKKKIKLLLKDCRNCLFKSNHQIFRN